MEGDAARGSIYRYWVGIVAACVVLHASISLIRGYQQSPHHHISVWLWVSIALSFAGGWWVALKPARLQANNRTQVWAFVVAAVLFYSFDLLVRHSGGVLIRNGSTSLAWIAGVGVELGRQAFVRRRGGAAAEAVAAG